MKFNEKYYSLKQHIYCDDNRKTLSLEETKGVKYIGTNKNAIEYTVYRVDKGLISTNETKQCDFAIYVPSSDSVRLIELKGGNIDDGVEQLIQTIDVLIKRPNISVTKLYAILVAKKFNTPALLTTKMKKLKTLVKSYKGEVIPKSIKHEEPIN
ncbi:hypothetical protein HX057_14095 [Myroides odoratimimus]|uniref:hypothetical protein n=1 Tax=Myroides TaxID=76831 RepID=UPI000246191F|nr:MULTISPECIES: hypothetical protein [Myroides]APA90910.1 hypothetical protein BK054_01390 [Myroides sp. ZB35]EHO06618.1 hypothetical protein HMPREF9714_02911 [Myroides odoratimimus CCUG 12901]EKB02152.1 hypothetical protein HMPREF9711_03538 [Myroides odoratimimus CCUG 3837]MDM1402063.1 hypothetical protein [Myroides odoratimimus]MDM1411899.1 hypothetical protein [Myroides odoratimimus]